jgi:predicted enzyme related to lactoylglutathione lyase
MIEALRQACPAHGEMPSGSNVCSSEVHAMVTEAMTAVVRGIDATYYMTKDLAAATAFYNDLFGMVPAVVAPGMFAEYTFPDGASFGLYESSGFYPGGTAMFAVDDVAAFVAAAQARGVAFAQDGKIEDSPSCWMAFGSDPDGNQFIIHKRK